MPAFEKIFEVKGKKKDVWEALTDFERYKDRTLGVKEIEITSSQKKGLGVTFHESGEISGEKFEADNIITEWVDEERIVQRSSSRAETKTTTTITLEPIQQGKKTRLTYRVNYHLPPEYDEPNVQEALSKFFESTIKKLKDYLEKEK